jgi:hypothetical protein
MARQRPKELGGTTRGTMVTKRGQRGTKSTRSNNVKKTKQLRNGKLDIHKA